MSVSIEDRPFEVSLSRNPVVYKMQSDNLYDSIFIFPSLQIDFINTAATGYQFSFNFKDPNSATTIELRFIAVPNPDDSGKEFIDSSYVGVTYAQDVAAQIEQHPVLSSYYDVSIVGGGNSILFTAKQAIEELIPTDFDKSNGLTIGSETTLTDFLLPNSRSNFKIVLEVWFEDVYQSNDWRLVGRESSVPDNAGEVFFDIADILDASVQESYQTPPLPEFDPTQIAPLEIQVANVTRRYYIRYAESFGGQLSVDNWLDDRKLMVHHGGISSEDFAKGNFFLYQQANKRFSTWLPNKLPVKETQPQYLSWINYLNIDATISLKFKVYFTDGTDSGDVLFGAPFDVLKWETLLLPAGHNQIGVKGATPPGKVAYKWDIWIEESAAVVTEIRTYYLDCSFGDCDETILYLNGLCSPETFLTSGRWRQDFKIDRIFGNKSLAPGYMIINGQQFQFSKRGQDSFMVRSGYISKDLAIALKAMLITNSLFHITAEGYFPVVMSTDSFEITECKQFLHSLEFAVKRAFTTDEYSAAGKQPLISKLLDCGLTGFAVDDNDLKIQSHDDLEIFEADGVTSIEVVAYDAPSKSYPLATKIIEEDNYVIKVSFNLGGGNTLDYVFVCEYLNEHASYVHSETAIQQFTIGSLEAGTDFFVDWGLGAGEVPLIVGTTPTAFGNFYPIGGSKKVDISLPCADKIDVFAVGDTTVLDVNVQKFVNLESLIIAGDNYSGKFSLITFPKLAIAWLLNSAFTEIEVGFVRDLDTLIFSDNELGIQALEDILYGLWKYRKLYTVVGIFLNISGNPGIPNLSIKSQDILAGTTGSGLEFENEGLVTDYGWIVIL